MAHLLTFAGYTAYQAQQVAPALWFLLVGAVVYMINERKD